jgi:putative transferase (TIGR04331 family)
VLPSPWADHSRYEQAAVYVDNLYERALRFLTDCLNHSHRVDNSVRYWRILIGPWLRFYIDALYDRYAHVSDALRTNPDAVSVCLDDEDWVIARDTLQFSELVTEDAFNLQLFSQVFNGLGLKFETRRIPQVVSAVAPEHRLLSAIHSTVSRIVNFLPNDSYVGVLSAALPGSLPVRLFAGAQVRMLPVGVPRISGDTEVIEISARRTLGSFSAQNEFECILAEALPYGVPTLFFEGYRLAAANAAAYPRRLPRVLLSTDWFFTEGAKFILARASQESVRLLGLQHGGGYGTLRNFFAETHERAVADKFLVWGWEEQDGETLRNVPAPALSAALRRKTHKKREASDIVFATTNHPRYLHRFHSAPVGSQWNEYWADATSFLLHLDERTRALIRVRLRLPDFGQDRSLRFLAAVPGIRFDDSTVDVTQRLLSSRMVVVDHPMTMMLEALRLNVPTVVFFDPTLWELRTAAQPFFERLREARVVCDTPEDAAAQVKAVSDEPESWWRNASVQRARNAFVEEYALSIENWIPAWRDILRELLQESRILR